MGVSESGEAVERGPLIEDTEEKPTGSALGDLLFLDIGRLHCQAVECGC